MLILDSSALMQRGFSVENVLRGFVRSGFLLHGSSRETNILKPDYAYDFNSFNAWGNLRAVYATVNPSIAIFFAVTPRKCLKRFDLEPSAKIKKFFIDSRYLKRFSSGFVYILPPRGFERIGDNILSFNAVKPLLKIKVNPADFKHKVEAMKYEYRQDKIFDFNKVLKVAIKHAPKLNCNHDTGHILRSSIYARIMAIKTCPEYLNEIMLGVILHDIGRINNQRDPYHPKRSARLARDILKKHWPGLNTGRIIYAIENHNMGKTTTDPVIGIIWDADRLDLVRLGIKVDKKLLSTKIAPKLIPLARLVCTKMKLS